MNIELIDKLWSKTSIDKERGCWLWKGSYLLTRGQKTYGYITENRQNKLVHRLSVCIYLGLDYHDASWDACHLCPNKHCWNPLHLYVGTKKTNAMDRFSGMTHCKNGHERNATNTYINTQGSKMCKVCAKEYQRLYKEKR